MDDNKLLMIVLAFILGLMASKMMKSMCGGRLVEGAATKSPAQTTTTPSQTTAPAQTTIKESVSPATKTTKIQGKTCEACACRIDADNNSPEWCCAIPCLNRTHLDDKFCGNPNKDDKTRNTNLQEFLKSKTDKEIYELSRIKEGNM